MRKNTAVEKRRRVFAIAVGVISVIGLPGCADLQLSDAELQRISESLQEGILRTNCQPGNGNPGPRTIDIEFENKGTEQDPIWCPKSQVESCPEVFANQQVRWRAVKRGGEGELEPLKTGFTVYYSPFPNGSINGAPGTGMTGPRTPTQSAPEGVYKYTVAPSTVTATCPALDPNIWVHD